MSRGARAARAADRRLAERLDVLAAVADRTREAPGRLPDEVVDRLDGALARARGRVTHGPSHTVVALAGATGSGKSSLFNALAGEGLADVGVRRPTTSTAQAAVFDATGVLDPGAADLLDWLAVPRRHVVTGSADLDGLVLVDLPDHDSTAADHRAEVDRLVEVVDAFAWVVDPQKYADAALHDAYLRRFAGHDAVTLVVLNQVDRVPADDRRAVLDDLRRLLVADGLADARVMATSATGGEGIAELRRELAARLAERRAMVARLHADVDRLAEDLDAHLGTRPPGPVPTSARRRLTVAVAEVAGAEAVADAVGAAHRARAAQHVGWPPTRWVRRLRPDPLRRLGLDRTAPAEGTATGGRTSRPAPAAVSQAGAAAAVRTLVDDVTTDLPDAWTRRVAAVADARREDLADALDRAVGAAELPTRRPAWWSAASSLQWVLAGVMAVGLVWLAVIAAVAWFGLPDLPTPRIGEVPWPTAMALGGALAGLLVSALGRLAAAVGARRRRTTARRILVAAASAAADELVVDPVDRELAALAELHQLTDRLR
ncbi:GTPase [Euzebya sp.]|uniref:GTPase n=1 Tax=Euzebya sp. TaxID=1971409 RepID=UPI003511724D